MKKLLLTLSLCLGGFLSANALATTEMPNKPVEQNACKPSCEGIAEGKCNCTEVEGNKCCVEAMDDAKDDKKMMETMPSS